MPASAWNIRRVLFAVEFVENPAVRKQRDAGRIPIAAQIFPLTLPAGEEFTAALHLPGQAGEGGLLVGIDDEAVFIAFLRAGTVPAVVAVEAPTLDGLSVRRWG